MKWTLRYLRGTTKKCLCFGKEKPVLVSYIDADLVGDIDSWKSSSGYLTTFVGGSVSWQFKLQKCVALSTTKAKYIAAAKAYKEITWMRNFLVELGYEQDKYVLRCDS